VSAPGPAPAFRPAAAKALKNPQLRANFRRAMDGLMAKRAAMFSDPAEWRDLRALGAAIRARTLAKLPELLETLERNCAANGIRVRWAETTEEANAIVLEILKARGATRVVKGKSMVSEEMHLNDFLERHGIESLESDLGEYIIQLDHETPSHIIMPAIHKNKQQIAKLFGRKIREARYTEDVDELTGIARRVLRRKFFEADAGISGVNFAVAAIWRVSHRHPTLYRLTGFAATRLRQFLPSRLPVLSAWTSVRTPPRPARRTLHELARKEGVEGA
jgi:L-lactate dehydrogenase complex protein LldF